MKIIEADIQYELVYKINRFKHYNEPVYKINSLNIQILLTFLIQTFMVSRRILGRISP